MAPPIRPKPTRLKLIVFDLDGTLIDSAEDLCTAVNAMLERFGRKPLPEAVIASYIGDGAPMLVRRALGDPADGAFFDSAVEFFLDYYQRHKLDRTRVYPHVFSSLDLLRRDSGLPRSMAVLTNKPIGPSKAICDALGLSPYFFRIYGGNSFPVKKPDPTGLRELMREAAAEPEETVMVGDTAVDILTARNAGALSVACKYGMAPHSIEEVNPDKIVESAADWPEAISALNC